MCCRYSSVWDSIVACGIGIAAYGIGIVACGICIAAYGIGIVACGIV